MFTENIKTKLIFILLFIFTFTFTLNINEKDKNKEIDIELNKTFNQLQKSYEAVVYETSMEATSSSSIVHQDELVIDTMNRVLNSDEDTKEILRKKLFKHLEPLYQMLQSDGVISFHFVLPNNESFLRLHQPERFGDNISSLRYTYKNVNETKKQTFGLEEGAFNISYRHVFPLFNSKNKYLGAYELSYSLKYIQNLMKDIDGINTTVLLIENSFTKDGWEDRYSEINEKISKGKKFVSFIANNSKIEVASFYPLANAQKNKTIAYLISYSKSPYIDAVLTRDRNKNITSFIILFIIFVLLYRLTIYQRNITIERERFQLAIDSSNDGIWDWNITKNTTYFSPQFKKMLGFDKSELNGSFKELQLRIHKDDKEKFLKELEDLLSSKKDIFECEYRVKHKDEKWIWILGRAKAQYDKDHNAIRVVGFHSDITLKKEYENHQEELIQELKDVADAKSNFLATMSHEIRTPMNAVLGFIQILARKEDDPKKLKMLHTINESGNSLLRIINDILDFSKISNDKLEIDATMFKIRNSLDQVQNLYASKADEKELSIRLKIDERIPQEVYGDNLRIEQILSNLLSNAIKFSKNKTTININVTFIKSSHAIQFEVTDHGIGIPKNKLDHIFETFTQEDNSTTRKYGGTGLGLAISKKLCKLMGGNIWVESKHDIGSSFYFTLPQPENVKINNDITLNDDYNVTKDADNTENFAFEGNVLIVEDNKVNQELLSMILAEYSIKHMIADDGLQAIGLLQNQKFDLILMDENMPNMNGIEATKIIRGMDHIKDIPIVAVTANALIDDRDKFLKAGMNDYISKPISTKELDNILKKYLSYTKG